MRVSSGAHVVSIAPNAQANRVDQGLQQLLKERNLQHKKEVKMLEETFVVMKDIAKMHEKERDEDNVNATVEMAKTLMDSMANIDINTKVLNEMFHGNQKNDEGLTQFMARRLEELMAGRREDAYTQHSLWSGLRRELWEINHPEEPLPEEEGAELVVVARQRVLVCPLTQAPLEEPVKSVTCGHVFSKGAVEDYIKRKHQARQPAKCPVAGCSATLTQVERDIETEHALKKRKKPKTAASTKTLEISQSQHE